MRHFLLISVLCMCAAPVSAYNPISAEPTEMYSVIQIEGDPYIERTYLGDLEDAPDLYEFTTDVAISVRIQAKQRSSKNAVPFGLIMVRQNDENGGVEEIVRQNESLEKWEKERNYAIGMSFLAAPVLSIDVKPGTYRIEVSTPDNKGAYALVIGEETTWPGYFKSVWYAIKTQYHFGYTPFQLLLSVYICGTLAILGIGFGMYYYRRYCTSRHGNAA